MELPVENKIEAWRQLAAALRADAVRATMPGFAEKLLRAAMDLEDLGQSRQSDSGKK